VGNVRQAGRQAGRAARRDRAIIERGAERDRSMQQERERTIVLLDGRLAGAWRVSASELEENGGARARRHASTTITHGHDQRQRGEEDGGAVMVERAREAVHPDAALLLYLSLSLSLSPSLAPELLLPGRRPSPASRRGLLCLCVPRLELAIPFASGTFVLLARREGALGQLACREGRWRPGRLRASSTVAATRLRRIEISLAGIASVNRLLV